MPSRKVSKSRPIPTTKISVVIPKRKVGRPFRGTPERRVSFQTLFDQEFREKFRKFFQELDSPEGYYTLFYSV
jgi:hypothetical protein